MKFNDYPVVTEPSGLDTALIYQESSGAVKQISLDNLLSLPDFGQGVINVKWYGAKGDGTTDDTAAITAAIAAAGANQAVYFPPSSGSYIITSVITVTKNDLKIFGHGANIEGSNPSQYRFFRFTGCNRVVLDGLNFDGNYSVGAGSLGAGCAEIVGSSDVTIRNCTFYNVIQSGVFISSACERTTVTGCKFYNNFCAIFSDDDGASQPSFTRITNNDIRDGIGGTTTAFSGGIKVSGLASLTAIASLVVADNVIERSGQMGIELHSGCNNSSVTGNSVKGCGFGISIAGLHVGVAVTGNSIRGCDQFGIELASGSRSTVSGNAVSCADDAGVGITDSIGILVTSYTSAAISGNAIHFSQFIGIHCYISNKVQITGNNIIMYSREGIRLQNSYKVNVTGNSIAVGGANCYNGIVVDVSASAGGLGGYVITGNTFQGTFDFTYIRFYSGSGSAVVENYLIANNDTSGAVASAGTAVDYQFGGSTSYVQNGLQINNTYNGTSQSGYAFNNGYVETSSSTALVNLDFNVLGVDANGGARTITLPPAARVFGQVITIKKVDASGNAVTVDGNGAETIEGAATVSLAAQWNYVTVRSTGSAWIIVT